MLIAVDFDGTIVEHKYPEIGREIPFATQTLKQLIQDGHRLVLWTNRQGDTLTEAVEFCRNKGVEFYAVNKCYPEENLEESNEPRKILADVYIDDKNLGGLPDWGVIYQLIKKRITYQDYLLNNVEEKPYHAPKKHWWNI